MCIWCRRYKGKECFGFFFPAYICKPQTSTSNSSQLSLAPTLYSFHKACRSWLLSTSYISWNSCPHSAPARMALSVLWCSKLLNRTHFFSPVVDPTLLYLIPIRPFREVSSSSFIISNSCFLFSPCFQSILSSSWRPNEVPWRDRYKRLT